MEHIIAYLNTKHKSVSNSICIEEKQANGIGTLMFSLKGMGCNL